MKKLSQRIAALEDWISGILTFAGLMVIVFGVFLRYVLKAPVTWTDEISRFLIIWGVLIGTSVALRENQHIRVEFFYEMVPTWMKRFIDIFANLFGFLFCVYLVYYGSVLIHQRFVSGQVTVSLGIPLWMIYLIIPLFGLMLGIRFFQRLLYVLLGHPEAAVQQANEYEHLLQESGSQAPRNLLMETEGSK